MAPNCRKFFRYFNGLFSGGNVVVRSLRGQPRIPAFCQASQETREWAGNPGFSRIRFGLWTPALPNLRRKSPKVSGRFREYSRFGETIGGDGFDQDCRPRPGVTTDKLLRVRLSVLATDIFGLLYNLGLTARACDGLPHTSPDTSITTTAMRLRTPCGMRSVSICSISAAVFGRSRSPGGAGISLGRLSPNQKTP